MYIVHFHEQLNIDNKKFQSNKQKRKKKKALVQSTFTIPVLEATLGLQHSS